MIGWSDAAAGKGDSPMVAITEPRGCGNAPRQQVLRDLLLAFAIVTFASTVKTAKVTAIRSYLIDLMP
jgi:hypothetical protein